MTILGRAKIDHPALGTVGGSGLHTSIETIYTNLANHLGGRFNAYTTIANSTTNTYEHNFGVAFEELDFAIYTGTHPALTRVTDLVAAGWTVIATVGFEKTKIDITTPAAGGPHTFAIFVIHSNSILENKEIKGGTASNTKRWVLPSNTLANLNALTDVAGSIAFNTTSSKPAYNDGSTFVDLAAAVTATPTVLGNTSSYFATIQSSVKTIATGDWVANAFSVGTTDGYQVFLCETGSTARTLNLPAAASNVGRLLEIKLIGSTPFPLTIDPNASEDIDGLTTIELAGFSNSMLIICKSTGWEILKMGPRLLPSFKAYAATTTSIANTMPDTDVTFDTEEWDNGGYFASSTFTPKVKGRYVIIVSIRIDGITNSSDTRGVLASVKKNGSVVARQINGVQSGGSGAGAGFAQCSTIVELNGDTDTVKGCAGHSSASGSLNTVTGAGQCVFEGHYLGPIL